VHAGVDIATERCAGVRRVRSQTHTAHTRTCSCSRISVLADPQPARNSDATARAAGQAEHGKGRRRRPADLVRGAGGDVAVLLSW